MIVLSMGLCVTDVVDAEHTDGSESVITACSTNTVTNDRNKRQKRRRLTRYNRE